MRTRELALCFLVLLQLNLLAADDNRVTPEKCSLQSPGSLLAQWEIEDAKSSPGCEACIDNFYRGYAAQLAKKTDALDPKAKEYRGLLLKCFEAAFDYLAEVHDHQSTNHLGNRISGELEWILYCGARDRYQGDVDFGGPDTMNGYVDDTSDYTPELIRQIALAIGRANALHLDPQLKRFDRDLLPIFDRALAHFAEATKAMDETKTRYFRRYLAVFITRFP